MKASDFYSELTSRGLEAFYGVPDSLLKELCSCISESASAGQHIIAANEGNALALAAGHYLATGKPAVVYMQNSGLGNVVNPLLSLTDAAVYSIPALLVIGWRGEPGVHDEPQHITQGRLTLPLLEALEVEHAVLEDLSQVATACEYMATHSRPYALVVRKGTFEPYPRAAASPRYELAREDAIRCVTELLGERDVVVSTTGMISRELYENRPSHEKDFLTVGSMGHASSIALGIALAKPERRVYCMDGDGALLMHLGATAVLAAHAPGNLRHILINNEAHDSVGAQPTVMPDMDVAQLAYAVGYRQVHRVQTLEELRAAWPEFAASEGLSLLEIRVKCGARKDLGRPKERPVENKQAFLEFLKD